jgi:hypothetical protein
MTAHLDEVLASGDATQADAVVEGLLALSAVLKVRALARR